MITQDIFERCVMRAALAPSVHNIQPARWSRDGNVLSLFCDTNICLPAADPDGRASALSCGAVLEGMVLALSAQGLGAKVALTGADTAPKQGLVAVAHLALCQGSEDGLHHQLERRFTWRGAFDPAPVALFGWTRSDTRLVMDQAGRETLADHNDWASFQILQGAGFRRELVDWMRVRSSHPRAGLDGMDRAALGMSDFQTHFVPRMLMGFWPLLMRFGMAECVTAQRNVTLTAPFIVLFHNDIHEDSVTTGRAYLRLCLEAASLGLAGWPMAALSDHEATRVQIQDAFGIPSDRRLVQAIRFGVPTGDAPARARRPLNEVLV